MALGEHLRILIGGRFDHAVDCGDRTVLHLAFAEERGHPAVKRSLLRDFTGGAERVEVVRHGTRTYAPKMVVSRAFSKLGDSTAWAMFPTAEHFVSWCLTGQAPVLPSEPGVPFTEGAPAPEVTALAKVPAALPPAKAAPRPARKKARPAKVAAKAKAARPAKRAKPAPKAKKPARKAPARKAPAKKAPAKKKAKKKAAPKRRR